jgi:hypothetical protein
MYYHNTGHSVLGVKWWWNEPGKESGKSSGNALILIPAGAMNGKTQQQIWELMKWLDKACQPKYTRIDIAVDDRSKALSYRQVLDACNSRAYAGFDKYIPLKPENKKRENLGFTIYLGSKESDKYVRYYDKNIESKEMIDAYRLEGVYKNEYAQKLAKEYIAISASQYDALAPKFLAGCVVGNIDFRETKTKVGEKNKDRRKRLDWWQAFIDRIGAEVKLGCDRICPTLQATVNWVKKQVAPTLAVLRRVLKPLDYRAFIDNLVDEKDACMTPTNEAKADVWFFERHTVIGNIPKSVKFWEQKPIAVDEIPSQVDDEYQQPLPTFSVGQLVRHRVTEVVSKVISCTHTHAQVQGIENAVSVWLLEPVL